MTTTYTSIEDLISKSINSSLTIIDTSLIDISNVNFPLTISKSISQALERRVAESYQNKRIIQLRSLIDLIKGEFYNIKRERINNNEDNTNTISSSFNNFGGDPMPGFDDEYEIGGSLNRRGDNRGGEGFMPFGDGDLYPGIGRGGMHPTIDDPLFHPEERHKRNGNNPNERFSPFNGYGTSKPNIRFDPPF